LRDKIKYAIHFCKSIDTDEYARVAIPGSEIPVDNNAIETTDETDDGLTDDEEIYPFLVPSRTPRPVNHPRNPRLPSLEDTDSQ
jgi:hypothetical protein